MPKIFDQMKIVPLVQFCQMLIQGEFYLLPHPRIAFASFRNASASRREVKMRQGFPDQVRSGIVPQNHEKSDIYNKYK